ncbi:MerC domain-containing protein [Sphingomonas sp. DT-204]|uniref:MerC domain-containing protein n=1 Tax=Sphingomonas sp. DT-204 TaxID=3396166 RepID=UPI003F1CF0B2
MCAKTTATQIDGQRRTDIIEGAAVSASVLCLVHCLALPLLLLLLPGIIGLFARSEAFHYVALALVVPSAAGAFWLGYRRHRTPGPALLGVAGVGCLVAALLPGLAEGAETWVTVAGSLLLVIGHTLNWRWRTCAA